MRATLHFQGDIEPIEQLRRQVHVAAEAGAIARFNHSHPVAPLQKHVVALAQGDRQLPSQLFALTAMIRQPVIKAGGGGIDFRLPRGGLRAETGQFAVFFRLVGIMRRTEDWVLLDQYGKYVRILYFFNGIAIILGVL